MKIILASASPRRQELLKIICSDFETLPADVDESIPSDIQPEKVAQFLAVKKANHVLNSYPNDIIIGCDTTVIIDNKILGKPVDENDCKRMLETLSGRTHKVVTGVAVCFGSGKRFCFSETTYVKFYELSNLEMTNYIATNEPFDKAGGYGIQGFGAVFVEKIDGDYFNVVGLPIAKLKRVLDKEISLMR
ncbi:MAG TPA: septum formation inhibitor Maf [Clostridiales bacterium]|nr:septum formation inhibitor Maf [Clostridiales bacterium]